MKKLVLVTLALVMIVSLSIGAVSAGWYGSVYISGNSVGTSQYHGKAWGTKNLSSYVGHALVEVGYLDGSGSNIGTVKGRSEDYNYAYSGTLDFSAEKTASGNCTHCLSEVTGSDGRSYSEYTYH